IKPLLPMPVAVETGGAGSERRWLDAATASLWTWTLVVHTLERLGFRGVAWKWGDEPQIAARVLAGLRQDLSGVDAVRFGAADPEPTSPATRSGFTSIGEAATSSLRSVDGRGPSCWRAWG
ncbi:MAG: hypothetical protein KC457_32160, partial [Myxococcales bacterium]|nr:hypothetical protein [Myxococcales bacterium]